MKLEEAINNRFSSEGHKASVNILYTAYWLRNNITQKLKEPGITMEQFNVMRILKGKHPTAMCVKDIGSRMIEKSSNVPRIIDRLVAKKLAKRTPSKEDKRETLVSITEKGMSLLEDASKMVDEIEHNIVNLTADEAAQLNELLDKMKETPQT